MSRGLGDVYKRQICRDDKEAVEELSHLCDLILSHDRKIRIRADDSVMDFYKGELSGLAVCEVEFDDENQAKEFLPPYFFGKEITGDARYRNRNLALNGLPET